MTPAQLVISLRRLASQLDQDDSPSKTKVAQQLTSLRSRMASGQFIHFRLDRSWMDSRTSYAPLTVRTFGGEKEYPEGMTIVDLGNGVQITKPYYGPSWARLVVNGKCTLVSQDPAECTLC